MDDLTISIFKNMTFFDIAILLLVHPPDKFKYVHKDVGVRIFTAA